MSLSSSMSGGLVGRQWAGAAEWVGAAAVPSSLLVLLVLLPLGAAVLPRWLARRTAPRVAAAALVGCAAVAAYLLFSPQGLGGIRGGAAGTVTALVQPLWRVLAVQRLQLAVGLALDRPAAALLAVTALLGAWAVHAAERRQVAWLAGAWAATAVALLGDSLVTRLVGWELLTVAGWALSRRRAGVPLFIAHAGDATLLVATALLFWALGGSWSSSRLDARYQLDFSPPATAAAPDRAETAAVPGPTLNLLRLHAQLHPETGGEPGLPTVRAALHNKLWLGGRLLNWLTALFMLAAALKAASGILQLLTVRGKESHPPSGHGDGVVGERRSTVALRLWLFVAPVLGAWHLLWSLR